MPRPSAQSSSNWTTLELIRSNSMKSTSSPRDSDDEDDEKTTGGFYWCSCCIKGCIIGSLIVGIVLAAVLAAWLTSGSKGKASSITTSPSNSPPTSTNSTSTSTSTTTTTSSSSSSSTSWSSTSTSITSAITTVSTTTTSSTRTTETTTTSTSTTTITSVTTTTTVTTTTQFSEPCHSLRWDQTGVVVAGTGISGSALDQFNLPECIQIDENDSMYICDHHNARVMKWIQNATSGIIVTNPYNGDHVSDLAIDKNGSLYISDHGANYVLRYSSPFSNGTVVAGQSTGGSTSLSDLKNPRGLDVDDDFNVYVADQNNARIVQWAPNANTGSLLINSSVLDKFVDVLLVPWSSNQVYTSSDNHNSVYLWTFLASAPSVTLTAVNATASTLSRPAGIKLDIFGNLYVADWGNTRIVMYCANSTIGQVVVDGTASTPTLMKPIDIALDSNLNLYVVDSLMNQIVKFNKI